MRLRVGVVLFAAWALVLTPVSSSAAAVSTTFTFTGAEQTFVVPAGVTGIHVVAIGGTGQAGVVAGGAAGGAAATVGADVAVTPGATLYVEVGGNGTAAGAFGGGGGGGGGATKFGGGGGGATDIRTCSKSSVCSGFGTASDPRLLVAGGGGGGGGTSSSLGGPGGAAGVSAQAGTDGAGTACSTGGGGGGGASLIAGGTAGSGGSGGVPDGVAGTAGTPDQGGSGGDGDVGSGGGGGGGFFGGGGGGGGGRGACGLRAGGGGGGAGSSYLGPSTSNGTITTDVSGTPSVTITYTLSVAQAIADLQDVISGLGLPKGLTTALNGKLDDVLAALDADDTAGACDRLQAFLNQVSAQEGKKLTGDQAQQITDAANEIRATLGC
jgi:hypothetical protein